KGTGRLLRDAGGSKETRPSQARQGTGDFCFRRRRRPRLANVSSARRSNRGGIRKARKGNRVRRRISTCSHAAHRSRKPLQKERAPALLCRLNVRRDSRRRIRRTAENTDDRGDSVSSVT